MTLAQRLTERGAEHAAVAAAVLVCRGRRLLDHTRFAALLGVSVEHVRSLESGRRPPEHAPRRLVDLDGTIDWAAAGIRRRGDPTDPASRHPAAHPTPLFPTMLPDIVALIGARMPP